MRLTPRQAAALQPLLAEKQTVEARIGATIRAFLVSSNYNPSLWTGAVDIDDLGNVTIVLKEPDAAP